MSYKCYLFGELMPQTPAKLTLKIKGKNSTVTLLNEGEINFLKYPGLTEITLPLVFPMLTAGKRPDYYLALLERAKTQRIITQFIMTRTTPSGQLLFDTNIKVSVEDYTIEENATNGLDVSVEVKLKQYREYSTKTVTVKAAGKDNDNKIVKSNLSIGENSADSRSNAKIFAGDKVKIVQGAVYGGLYDKTRGLKVPSAYTDKWYTVTKVQTNAGTDEALIEELYSWVALKYLQKQGSQAKTAEPERTVTIYQLNDTPEAEQMRFMRLDYMKKNNLSIDIGKYNEIYTCPMKDGESLEDIFTRFNVDRPADFKGRSLSVSDVVSIRENGKDTAYFVDCFGFKEIPDFFKDKAVKEKKPSVLKQLKDCKQSANKPKTAPKPKKSKETEVL